MSFDDILDEFEKDVLEEDKPINLVTFILDRSGSMSGSEKYVMDTFNKQLKKIREEGKDQETYVSLILFSDPRNGVEIPYINRTIDKVGDLLSFHCFGGTALYDTIGNSIGKLEQTLEGTDEKDVSVLYIIITDGYENASIEFKGEQIKNKIKALEDTDKWTFTFLGADHDVFEAGSSINITSGNTMAFSKTAKGFETASKGMSRGISAYYSSRTLGQKSVKNFYEDSNTDDDDPNVVETSSTTEEVK